MMRPSTTSGVSRRWTASTTIHTPRAMSAMPLTSAATTRAPLSPEGAWSMAGRAAPPQPQQRQRQGGGIAQHVAGIGDQRQRAGDQAADHLDRHEDDGDRQRQAEPAGIARGRVIMGLAG